MFEIIQKIAPAPPTGLYSPVAPLTTGNCNLSICTVPVNWLDNNLCEKTLDMPNHFYDLKTLKSHKFRYILTVST